MDVCGPRDFPANLFPLSGPENLKRKYHGPIHQKYATIQSRLDSFKRNGWPRSMKQRPETLADAGFFYEGISDHVLCFSCDGGLKNWEPEDEPWIEHAKWFDECVHLNLMKSKEFIAFAKSQKDPATKNSQTPAFNEADKSLKNGFKQNPFSHGANLHCIGTASQSLSGNLKSIESKSGASSSSTSSTSSTSSCSTSPTSSLSTSTLTLTSSYEPLEFRNDTEMCRICYERERNIVFLPCGHLVTCPNCASAFSICPMCRAAITGIVKTYKS